MAKITKYGNAIFNFDNIVSASLEKTTLRIVSRDGRDINFNFSDRVEAERAFNEILNQL